MKVAVKRKEFAPLMLEMKSLTGLKLKQALSFGKDQRLLQVEIDTLPDFEKTKPERLVELQKLFEEKAKTAQVKDAVGEQQVLNDWELGNEFAQLLADYRKKEVEFLNEEVELTFKTTFKETDLKLESVSAKAGWMLTYFMK